MDRKELKILVLNIAMDLDRVAKFAMEGKEDRRIQFLALVNERFQELKQQQFPITFFETFQYLEKTVTMLNTAPVDVDYVDTAFTTATILSHRGIKAIDIIYLLQNYDPRM